MVAAAERTIHASLSAGQVRPEVVAVLATAYPNHPRAEESLKTGIILLSTRSS
jgi:hypothetical protein